MAGGSGSARDQGFMNHTREVPEPPQGWSEAQGSHAKAMPFPPLYVYTIFFKVTQLVVNGIAVDRFSVVIQAWLIKNEFQELIRAVF